jgi:DNA-binding NarL/FixJ family response regulator
MQKKIFVVEDDKILSTITVMFIKDLGCELVGTCQEGLGAIKMCKSEALEPDLFLMDIHITGNLNGIETSKLVRNELNVPVIYISSDNAEHTIRHLLQINFYGYLVKPYEKKTLKLAIELAMLKFSHEQKILSGNNATAQQLIKKPDGSLLISDRTGWIIDVDGIKFKRPMMTSDPLEFTSLPYLSPRCLTTLDDKIEYAIENDAPIDYFECELFDAENHKHPCGLIGFVLVFNNHKAVHFLIKKL